MRVGILFAATGMLVSAAYAQDISWVSPNGKVTHTIDRTAQGVTISREGPHLSWSRSRGIGDNPTATASASATGTNFAYARASTSTSVRTNAQGQSIDIARARAVARGNISSSTSAHTTN